MIDVWVTNVHGACCTHVVGASCSALLARPELPAFGRFMGVLYDSLADHP